MTGTAGPPDGAEVYGPAEDSALLAATAVRAVTAGDRALDVGTGSGYVGEKLAAAGAMVIGSDVNPAACRQARTRGIEAVRGDLVSPFRDGVFDLVAFNPPYLPDLDGTMADWFETAVSGGPTGRAVVERFLDDVGRVLATDGRAFLLVSTLTGVEAVAAAAEARGLRAGVVAEDDYPGESLVVLRLACIT